MRHGDTEAQSKFSIGVHRLDNLRWLNWRERQLDSNEGEAADERETMRLVWPNEPVQHA